MANSTDKLKGRTVKRKQPSTKMKASAKMRRVNAKRARGTSTENLKSKPAGADGQGRVTKATPKVKQPAKKSPPAKRTGATRVKSGPTTKGNTSVATGRGNYQDKAHGERIKKTIANKTKTKLKGKVAKQTAKTAGKAVSKRLLGVAGAAAQVSSDRKKSEKAARRKAYSRATKKPLKS